MQIFKDQDGRLFPCELVEILGNCPQCLSLKSFTVQLPYALGRFIVQLNTDEMRQVRQYLYGSVAEKYIGTPAQCDLDLCFRIEIGQAQIIFDELVDRPEG